LCYHRSRATILARGPGSALFPVHGAPGAKERWRQHLQCPGPSRRLLRCCCKMQGPTPADDVCPAHALQVLVLLVSPPPCAHQPSERVDLQVLVPYGCAVEPRRSSVAPFAFVLVLPLVFGLCLPPRLGPRTARCCALFSGLGRGRCGRERRRGVALRGVGRCGEQQRCRPPRSSVERC